MKGHYRCDRCGKPVLDSGSFLCDRCEEYAAKECQQSDRHREALRLAAHLDPDAEISDEN